LRRVGQGRCVDQHEPRHPVRRPALQLHRDDTAEAEPGQREASRQHIEQSGCHFLDPLAGVDRGDHDGHVSGQIGDLRPEEPRVAHQFGQQNERFSHSVPRKSGSVPRRRPTCPASWFFGCFIES